MKTPEKLWEGPFSFGETKKETESKQKNLKIE